MWVSLFSCNIFWKNCSLWVKKSQNWAKLVIFIQYIVKNSRKLVRNWLYSSVIVNQYIFYKFYLQNAASCNWKKRIYIYQIYGLIWLQSGQKLVSSQHYKGPLYICESPRYFFSKKNCLKELKIIEVDETSHTDSNYLYVPLW